MSRVFVSYATEDEQWSVQLKHSSSALGLTLELIDFPAKAPFAVDWKSTARHLISRSSGLIILLGARTVRSNPVQWEIALAVALEKPAVAIRLSSHFSDHFPAVAHMASYDWPDRDRALREAALWP